MVTERMELLDFVVTFALGSVLAVPIVDRLGAGLEAMRLVAGGVTLAGLAYFMREHHPPTTVRGRVQRPVAAACLTCQS